MNKRFAKPWVGSRIRNGRFAKNGSDSIFRKLPNTRKFMERFLGFGNKRGGSFSEKTIKKYRIDLAEFFTFAGKEFTDVTDEDCERFFNYLKKRGLCDRSVTWRIMTVRAFFRFAVEKRMIQYNPMQIKAKASDLKPDDWWVRQQCLKRSEIKAILEATNDPRDNAILTLLYNHGCRIGELVNLKLEDVDMDKGIIRFEGKTGSRTNEMNTDTKNALKMWLLVRKSENRHLFVTKYGNPVAMHSIRDILLKICVRTGVMKKTSLCEKCKADENLSCKQCEWNKIVTPHSFRHTFICHCLEDGVNPVELSKIVGHNLNMILYYSALSEIGRTYSTKFKGIHGG